MYKKTIFRVINDTMTTMDTRMFQSYVWDTHYKTIVYFNLSSEEQFTIPILVLSANLGIPMSEARLAEYQTFFNPHE